jgi:Na+/H+-dicarboxylate symporter
MGSLNQRIGIAVILAILLGLILRHYQSLQLVEFIIPILEIIGDVFILLLKMIMIPLIFFSLISSISSLKKNKSSQLLWKRSYILLPVDNGCCSYLNDGCNEFISR